MYSGGCGFDPPVRQHSFMEIGHEILSTPIFSSTEQRSRRAIALPLALALAATNVKVLL